MDCPACGAEMVTIAIPTSYRAYAPDDANAAALCPTCLTLTPAEDAAPSPEDAAFDRIIDSFPEGDAGAAMALAVGLLVDSLVLNREAIVTLFGAVSETGHDPWLVLERLHVAGSVRPDADLAKARHQLEQLSG